MSSDAMVMQLVPVRLQPQAVEEIDELVALMGGNRSEFIRMAVDERLVRMRPLMVTLADAAKSGALTIENAKKLGAALGGLTE